MTNKQLINDLENLRTHMFKVAYYMINDHKNKEVQEKGEELMNASKMVHEWVEHIKENKAKL